jgi:Retrotransposon gag protein/Zinc knuckle
MSQGESTAPPPALSREPTAQEEADCPYLFEDLEAIFYKAAPTKVTYYAKWRGQDVWSRHIKGPWHFEKDNEDITLDHWDTIYPGYKHLVLPDTTPGYYGQTHLNRNQQKCLVGKLNGKLVLWSPTKNTFVYTNNLSATFPPDRTPSSRPPSRAPSRAQSPEESQDEAVVTSLLERAGQALTTLTEERRQRTPESSSIGAPGAFPETPPQKQAPTVLPTPSTEGTSTRVAAAEAPALPTVPESPTPIPAQIASSLVQGRSSPLPSQSVASTATQAPYTSHSKLPPAAVASSSKGKAPATTMSTSTAAPKSLGSPPEPYDGKPDKAEAFWSALESYFYLNSGMFADDNRKIATALTYFKVGMPAGEWARDKQKTALAAAPVDFGSWRDFKKNYDTHFVPAQSQLQAVQAMHNLWMGGRTFNDWYQEWSTHASRLGVDENTKMFAFRKNIPMALHEKIIALHPQPTTLKDLVEKASAFDQVWRVYRPQTSGRSCGYNARATAMGQEEDAQINLFQPEEGDRRPSGNAATVGKVSRQEKDRRFKEKLCFYCGKPGHQVRDCRVKKSQSGAGRKPGQRRDTRTRLLTTEESEPQEEGAPTDYDNSNVSLSRFYTDVNRYDILRPKSAPVDSDF